MRINFKSAIAGAGALAVAAGIMVAGASSASAAANGINYEPDANSLGTLSFFDATGNQISSGSVNGQMAAYYQASTAAPAGGGLVSSAYFTPEHQVTPAGWQTGEQQSSSQPLAGPYIGYPAPLANATVPTVKEDGGLSLQDHIDSFPGADVDNPNIYQVRLFIDGSKYWVADVRINSAAGTWTQVYPTVKASTTVSAISANPGTGAPSGSAVTLTGTVAASDATHPAGAAELFDGATDLGAATFTAATGAVTKTVTPANGAHSFKYVFTPTDAATYNGSTSPVLAYTVNAPQPASNTKVVLTAPATQTSGTPVNVMAAVSTVATPGNSIPAGTGVSAGKVQFLVDGVNSGAPVALDATGTAVLSFDSATAAAHVITATFVPTSSASYITSTSNAVTVTTTAPAYAPDPQDVKVIVPAGTLVISTPYTTAHPFDLGTLVLDADGVHYHSVPANFGDPVALAAADPGISTAPASTPLTAAQTNNGVTITDTRAVSTGWKASAVVTNFTSGANNFSGDLLTFSNVTPKFIVPNNLTALNTTATDITAFHTSAKQFAQATAGPGTVNVYGKMALTLVPSSVVAGTYGATITFTIV